MQSLQHIGAVRRVDVVVGQKEWFVQAVKAIGLAHGVGLVLDSQSEGKRQVRLYFPVVFPVESQRVQSNRLRQSCGEALLENRTGAGRRVHAAIKECRNRIGRHQTAGELAEVLIADVVAQELGSHLVSVIAQGLRKVIADLILRDVSPLREERIPGATGGSSADVEPRNVGVRKQ